MPAAPATVAKSLLALVLACAGIANGWAQEPRERRGGGREEAGRERGAQVQNRNRDALSDSVRRFERSNRGSRVLSAERMLSDGRDVNRIKAMDDRGRVRVYVDDPQRRTPEAPRRPPTRGDHD